MDEKYLPIIICNIGTTAYGSVDDLTGINEALDINKFTN